MNNPTPVHSFAVIVAAGTSERFGTPKLLVPINKKPLITLTVAPFLKLCDTVIVVLPKNPELASSLKEALTLFPSIVFVSGGDSRHESVKNAVAHIAKTAKSQDIVLVHDGARPLVSSQLITRTLSPFLHDPSLDSVIPALDIVDTVYRFPSGQKPHLDARQELKTVQTPQAFRYQPLRHILSSVPQSSEFPDEGSLFLDQKHSICFVKGENSNIKVTTPDDIPHILRILAPHIVHKSTSGYDVHRLIPGGGLILGGCHIPCPFALLGHSDADVLLHSLTDALYGLTASGDIGCHFPPSDPQWKNADSSIFLEHALHTLCSHHGSLSHIDITLIAETPKISPHALAIRSSLAALCHLPLDSISLKATTTEGLGFTGRKEGIASLAHVSASFLSPNP